MYKIEKKNYGYHLTFDGFIKAEEMKLWLEESKAVLSKSSGGFGVFVDMRGLKPLPADSQTHMQEGQQIYKNSGMVRSVVILDNPLATMQFKRIAKSSGIYEWERYIDASSVINWENRGIDWLTKGSDPDKL